MFCGGITDEQRVVSAGNSHARRGLHKSGVIYLGVVVWLRMLADDQSRREKTGCVLT